MSDSFLTIKSTSEGLYKEKGSKFIAFAYPVKSEEEVKEKIAGLKKQYYDARHHCYAFMLGRNKDKYRASDDGEPSNSAGQPILGQIRSKDLTDVLIVVIRYFGGTKLGVSGLINAYRTAAAEALENANIYEKFVLIEFPTFFEYPDMDKVMKIIKDYNISIISQEFIEKCKIVLSIREKYYEEVKGKLEKVPTLDFGKALK